MVCSVTSNVQTRKPNLGRPRCLDVTGPGTEPESLSSGPRSLCRAPPPPPDSQSRATHERIKSHRRDVPLPYPGRVDFSICITPKGTGDVIRGKRSRTSNPGSRYQRSMSRPALPGPRATPHSGVKPESGFPSPDLMFHSYMVISF